MKTTSSLLLQVLVGFILVILWFPSIIYFEYINKDNNDKTSDLNYKIKDYYLKSGKIKKIGRKVHTFDTSLGPIKINKSILSTIYNYKKIKKVVKSQEKSKNKIPKKKTYTTEYYWKKYGSKTLKDKKFLFTDNNNVKKILNMNDFKNSDFKNLLSYSNIEKIKLNKKIKAYNVPNGKLVTFFAKNNNLERVKHNKARIIYPGLKTRQGIIYDIKTSDFYFRWGMRLITFLMLFLGLQLITSPLRYVIEEAPHILDFPILNLFKWILVFMSDTILFFWDTSSIFGSLILTAIVTFIVFSLVNYPITLGITFATYFIITLIFLKKNK